MWRYEPYAEKVCIVKEENSDSDSNVDIIDSGVMLEIKKIPVISEYVYSLTNYDMTLQSGYYFIGIVFDAKETHAIIKLNNPNYPLPVKAPYRKYFKTFKNKQKIINIGDLVLCKFEIEKKFVTLEVSRFRHPPPLIPLSSFAYDCEVIKNFVSNIVINYNFYNYIKINKVTAFPNSVLMIDYSITDPSRDPKDIMENIKNEFPSCYIYFNLI